MHLPGAEADISLAVRVVGAPLGDDVDNFGGDVPSAVVAHGAGSDADFVIRAFGGPVVAAGWRLVAYDLRGHGASTPVAAAERLTPADHAADLLALAVGTGATLLGGVSMGAHAAVRAAMVLHGRGNALAGLLLAMPGWTGGPDLVAGANLLQAEEIERIGIGAALSRITRAYPGWVADELAGSWCRHDAAAFAATLRALGRSSAPSVAELAALTAPAGVVALADDPMHPTSVAEQWTAALPAAALRTVTQREMAEDRAALGRAAVVALAEAVQNGPNRS